MLIFQDNFFIVALIAVSRVYKDLFFLVVVAVEVDRQVGGDRAGVNSRRSFSTIDVSNDSLTFTLKEEELKNGLITVSFVVSSYLSLSYTATTKIKDQERYMDYIDVTVLVVRSDIDRVTTIITGSSSVGDFAPYPGSYVGAESYGLSFSSYGKRLVLVTRRRCGTERSKTMWGKRRFSRM